MGVFFWDYKNQIDYAREWSMFALNLLAFLFTAKALYSTARFHGKMLLELVPLTINCIATFILLMMKLFQKGYQFDDISYIIEVFTYFLFGYTFALIYVKSKNTNQRQNITKKVCNSLMAIMIAIMLVCIILVLIGVVAKECSNQISIASILSFAAEVASFLPTAFFSAKIFFILKRTENRLKHQSESFNETHYLISNATDSYITERKKQILGVMICYLLSLIIRLVLMILCNSYKDYFKCVELNDVYIITSETTFGQVILVFIELNQLLPHVFIPIALYVIPAHRRKRSLSINFDEKDMENEEYEEYNDHAVGRQIASTISSSKSYSNYQSSVRK